MSNPSFFVTCPGSEPNISSDSDNENRLVPDTAWSITERILSKEVLRVVDGEIWRYLPDQGYFRKLSDPAFSILASMYFNKKEERLAKAGLISEIKARICRQEILQFSYDSFNAEKNFLNCKNCVLKIRKKGIELCEHSADFNFTYCIDANYLNLPDPTAETFETYCRTSLGGDEKKRRLLLQIIGYVCSDFTTAKKAFFFKGAPDSGKSKIAEFIQKLVGLEFVSNVPLHGLGERFNKASLFGMKLNVQAEMKNTKIADISVLKAITGGDRIQAEFKGKDPFSFVPRAKLLFAGNALPSSKEAEATKAFLNRICLLIFPESIPKEKQDPLLDEKLWKEADAIFTLAINMLPELKQENFKFEAPEDSAEYLKYYAKSSNSLDAFLQDFCKFDSSAFVPVQEFLKSYKKFCQNNALEALKGEVLSSRLYEKYGISKRKIHRGEFNRYCFDGIKLKKQNN